ncbi:dTMP kinase [Blochmannia endosymbiont of Colobopsis nipponica]|uniref:dTMP kinase n=1 Tax=Blochmannia endosymbiont of Colobopsis nipponica TaxID=2681987 RepID=UPI00177B8DC8|nr:dTMP kinase [Blochmannia endosymbiont of Colobopsis nipponica]QOI11051.1 dTMP kinase [Blochmannia endosymbiont of Colobopsis nipponica]
MAGKFIVIEGLEGSGKSSAIKQVAKTLRKYGIYKFIITRDPGGTPLSEKLRILIKKGIDNEAITDYAELLMFYTARIQLLENVIRPALLRNIWVIGDRYDLSSQTYQGCGRKLDKMLLHILKNTVLKNFQPDLTLYLDVSPIIGLSRILKKRKLDRVELESLDFFNRVRSCYKLIAAKDHRIITIDANQELRNVHDRIFFYLKRWLIDQGMKKCDGIPG